MILLLFWMLAVPGSELERLTKEVADSGRAAELATPPSERVAPPPQIAPGPPPLLAFRYFDGNQRHRFNDTGLMLDDAGH